MTGKKKRILADLLLLATAIVWGGGFVAVKTSLDTVTPLYMIAFRFLIAAVAVSLVCWKRLRHLEKKIILMGSIPGVFLFLGFLFQTIGMQYTTASKNAFLTAVNVIWVPFLYWFIKKKTPKPQHLIAAAVCLTGMGFLTLDGQSAGWIQMGDFLTLLCSVFFALHIVTVGILGKEYHPLDITVVQLTTAALLGSVSAVLFEPFPVAMDRTAITGVLYLGLVSTFLAFLFQNLGQKYTSSTHASILLCLESPFGCLLSVLLLGERLGASMLIGCGIILAAVLISESSLPWLSGRRTQPEVAERSGEESALSS